ncbi:polyprenyl synthetase family protein [Chitinophaga pendula]|uniref:polyprenyl synthetase family protein n=1 Tax=Chitinophaga TaxID=79328 RepID=UPI000BB0B11C|nr:MULTISPECIES: polyprenyl synthetase family protein [Chitinophaga]ASZ11141.1 hypothetical protein CK934_09290 [Chitinophaga sp. MD30]UCJ05861.1 polyprenyl synthetase family protein [Chitinophaga pendula]
MESLHPTLILFQNWLRQLSFPAAPANLYDAITHFLAGGGKRLHPLFCLLGNELFGDVQPDAFHAATAIALYHHSVQVHDDLSAEAVQRQGRSGLPTRYNGSTALLAGDVLLIHAFSHINKIRHKRVKSISALFSHAAMSVCEGLQLEIAQMQAALGDVRYADYLAMIDKKQAALLAASIGIGAIIGGGVPAQQVELADFGRQMGMAFRLHEDYLDAFGMPDRQVIQADMNIYANRKTALLIRAMELCSEEGRHRIERAWQEKGEDREAALQDIYRAYELDKWLIGEMDRYTVRAFECLERVDVPAGRKEKLTTLADMLLVRQH